MRARRHRLRRFGALAAAAFVAVAVAVPAGAEDAVVPSPPERVAVQDPADQGTWVYSPDEELVEGDVTARMRDEDIDRAEAERRFRVEAAATTLEAEARRRWPDTFAGVWIDTSDFGVVVAFTQDEQANVDQLRSNFDAPDDLRAHRARRSLQALEALQEQVAGDRARLRAGTATSLPPALQSTGGDFDVDIDLPGNRVTILAADASTPLVDAATQTYGQGVAVAPGVSEPATCSQFNCTFAMMGGLDVSLGANYSAGACSSGFVAKSGSTRFMLSAGHCYANTGQHRRDHNTYNYGYTDRYQMSGSVDAERNRKYNSAWKESSKVWVAGEDPRMITSTISYSNMVVGTYIAKSGRRTGTTRGYVTSKTYQPSYVPNGTKFLVADLCVNSGDSGGAVFRNGTAWGIVSGKILNTSCRGPSGGRGIFGAIGYATSALGVSLLTGVNLAPSASFTSSCSLLDGCSFDGRGSDDEDGRITTYRWDFGDGNTASGKRVSHDYLLPGTYTVRLTVTDDSGTSRSTTRSVSTVKL